MGGWVYSEYVNNTYFQNYVNSYSPILVPIVSVGFGISSATIATLLYFSMRNIRQREGREEENLPKRRSPAKKSAKRPGGSTSRIGTASIAYLGQTPKPKPLNTGAYGAKRGAGVESGTEDDEQN